MIRSSGRRLSAIAYPNFGYSMLSTGIPKNHAPPKASTVSPAMMAARRPTTFAKFAVFPDQGQLCNIRPDYETGHQVNDAGRHKDSSENGLIFVQHISLNCIFGCGKYIEINNRREKQQEVFLKQQRTSAFPAAPVHLGKLSNYGYIKYQDAQNLCNHRNHTGQHQVMAHNKAGDKAAR